MKKKTPSAWDLTALLNAAQGLADAKTPRAERHLWLIRLLEWLRHAPLSAVGTAGPGATPTPLLRLKHLLNVLDRHPEHRQRVSALLGVFWRDIDAAALLADFGFAPRMDLWGELGRRLKARVLPLTPDTRNLGELFGLLFPQPADAAWLSAMGDLETEILGRLHELLAPALPDGETWRQPFCDAIMFLASAVRASGFSSGLRERMGPELLAEAPFRQLAHVAERVQALVELGSASEAQRTTLLREVQYLRAVLERCRHCALSVHDHLEEHGVSVDIVFEVDQLLKRTHRIDALLTCVLSPSPARDILLLMSDLVRTSHQQRSIRALFSRHYSLLARKVAERSAETGEQYITRDRAEYRAMLGAAAGGGAVIAVTTFLKFLILALGLSAFWGGFWAGVNYAASFVIVQLLHCTVATKQPAMTAPAMASTLADVSSDAAVESFVDKVTQLIRSQMAGIIGNVALVVPLVLGVQYACMAVFGMPLVGAPESEHVLESLTLLGPTALFAAFTGVLLFASSMIAGWAENWFVWHRLDSAIAWNPRIVARLGAARAQRWALYWRQHISGFASNVSLGMMLGVTPAVAAFFGLPIEVRHITLSAGQVAAATGALGWDIVHHAPFWWCVAGIAVTGLLNVSVSFFLAFRVALRSQGIRLVDRSRIYTALRQRLRQRPVSFILPPKDPPPTAS